MGTKVHLWMFCDVSTRQEDPVTVQLLISCQDGARGIRMHESVDEIEDWGEGISKLRLKYNIYSQNAFNIGPCLNEFSQLNAVA